MKKYVPWIVAGVAFWWFFIRPGAKGLQGTPLQVPQGPAL